MILSGIKEQLCEAQGRGISLYTRNGGGNEAHLLLRHSER